MRWYRQVRAHPQANKSGRVRPHCSASTGPPSAAVPTDIRLEPARPVGVMLLHIGLGSLLGEGACSPNAALCSVGHESQAAQARAIVGIRYDILRSIFAL